MKSSTSWRVIMNNMHRDIALFASIMIIVVSGILVLTGGDDSVSASGEPELVISAPKGHAVEPVTLSATSYAVFDVESGEVLVAKNESQVVPIASVTKLFTAASALKDSDLDVDTTITWDDVATEGRAGKLEAGDTYTLRELLWPLMLESSNDAAVALERSLPELLDDMNMYVSELGAPNTHFADTSGLSPLNVSTAAELASLTTKLYETEPHLFDVARLDQYIGEKTGWINNNPFAEDEDYRGGKHGFTYEAGRTGVFVFSEGERTVGYVVLGSDDLKADVTKLRQELSK